MSDQNSKPSPDLRTQETHDRYQEFIAAGHLEKGCPLCKEKETLEEFEHWRVVENDFPYDRIAAIHHMIIPKTHIREEDLSQAAKDELFELKHGVLNERYNIVIEALKNKKSIPNHFHLHLIKFKAQII